jgi:hypothetical protein
MDLRALRAPPAGRERLTALQFLPKHTRQRASRRELLYAELDGFPTRTVVLRNRRAMTMAVGKHCEGGEANEAVLAAEFPSVRRTTERWRCSLARVDVRARCGSYLRYESGRFDS